MQEDTHRYLLIYAAHGALGGRPDGCGGHQWHLDFIGKFKSVYLRDRERAPHGHASDRPHPALGKPSEQIPGTASGQCRKGRPPHLVQHAERVGVWSGRRSLRRASVRAPHGDFWPSCAWEL